MRWPYFLALMIFVLAGPVLGDEAESFFHQGNILYEKGDYAGAVELYEKALATGKESWQLHYNLGNAYYKLQKIGLAILHYERALELEPDNEDIRYNLDLANLHVVDRIPVPPRPAWLAALEQIFFAISFGSVLTLALLLYMIFMLCLTAGNWKPALRQRKGFRSLQQLGFVLMVLGLLWFGLRWYIMETEHFGIILQAEVSVTSSPTQDATEVFALHEGTKVKLEERRNGWVRIRLQDGKVGWLPTAAIGEI